MTARFVDVGALVQNSTTNKTSNQPVVTIADDRRLRVDVFVEQRDVPFVHVGDMADVADGANADRKITARVARTSNELDPRTRTLFVELDVDNTDHFLVAGSFAYVTLHIPMQSYPEIPVAGLITRGTRTMIADLGSDEIVHLRPVTVANTDGIHASLRDGATVGQRVAINLPDEVGDGARVQPQGGGGRGRFAISVPIVAVPVASLCARIRRPLQLRSSSWSGRRLRRNGEQSRSRRQECCRLVHQTEWRPTPHRPSGIGAVGGSDP